MPLHFYVEQGDVNSVLKQLAQGADVNEFSKFSGKTPLICALERTSKNIESDLELIRLLIERGADVDLAVDNRFGRFHGTPLLAAVQMRSLAKVKLLLEAGANTCLQGKFAHLLMDALVAYDDGLGYPIPSRGTDSLCSILNVLIEYGAALEAAYVDHQSGFRTTAVVRASSEGWFDAVRLLLAAGADPEPLRWNELMRAIALDPIEQLETLLAKTKNLNTQLLETDHYQRTPWLLSLVVGDLAKVERLFLAEADHCAGSAYYGSASVECAIVGDSAAALNWLVDLGIDLPEVTSQGLTPVMQAATYGSVECLKLLIELGADIFETVRYGDRAIHLARKREIIDILCAAGESLSNIEEEMLPLVTGVRQLEMGLSQKQFLSGRERRFGQTIPEQTEIAFWRAMVASNYSAYWVASKFGFQEDRSAPRQPTWCFKRFGRSITALPDGRVIAIAGEHEDFYDPDFCIYNDIVVYDAQGNFEIFSYPQEIFPPTDFHSATLIDNSIYIIGNLGYANARITGETPVYKLNCKNLAIREIKTTGNKPGWISTHSAQYNGSDGIIISGGKISGQRNGKLDYYDNSETYVLNLSTLTWRQIESH